jgi:hypothetical protein
MHSKLTFAAEKGTVLERLMSGQLHIWHVHPANGHRQVRGAACPFQPAPAVNRGALPGHGRAGRGTTTFTAEVEIVFDIKSVSGCLALIAGDPTGLANFNIAVIELLVDYEYYKHSFLSQALGDVNCIARARPRRECSSACTAACLEDPGFVCVDVTERVVALCAVVECFLALTGKVPTVSRLLGTSSENRSTNWAGEGKSWPRGRPERS